MAQDAFPWKVSEPETVAEIIRFVGGAGAVTKVLGFGATVTYVSTGLVDITWAESQGNFVGLAGQPSFQATTPGDVKSFVGIPGAYNSTTKTLRVALYESGSLADLAALEWCNLTALFKRTSV